MEEILRDLIKTTLEKGPQNKQFYSNLSITKGIHDHAEIHQRLDYAISYLRSNFKPEKGFQSKLYTSRNCAIESAQVCDAFKLPEGTVEVITSVLALDLLFNNSDNEHFVASSFQEIICSFSEEIQDALHNFIVPTSGISTFNLFKQIQQLSPVPSPSPILNLLARENLCSEGFDSGNDSPTSMFSSTTNPDNSENVTSIFNSFPDDINTSMLTLYVLIHQGILQPKPVESVLRWIVSNVFTVENEIFDEEVASSVSAKEPTKPSSILSESVSFPTFITRQGSEDPVAVANLLNLMYLLDVSHEVLLNSAEEFLVTTLKSTLLDAAEDTRATAYAPPSSKANSLNLLGNTQVEISSEDNGQAHGSSINNEDEASQEHQQSAFVLQHHSPDSLLYFLSRALAISSATNNDNLNETNCRRPYISQMKRLLLGLLDARLGTTMNTCDLAMRILAGVYLGVVNVSNNTTNLSNSDTFSASGSNHLHQRGKLQHNERYCSSSSLSCDVAKILRINNLLQKEFDLLVSLQNDVDGSWQADSIVKLGYCNDVEQSDDDCTNDSTEKYGMGLMGYLGGKELATLFAVKAIAVFLSRRKGSFSWDEMEDLRDTENANTDADLELHQLY